MGDVVKGDERAPKPRGIAKDIVTSLQDYIGGYMQQMLPQLMQGETAALQARQSIAPREQDLRAKLYAQYAPQYAGVQNQMDRMAGQNEYQNIRGAGGQAIRKAGQLQKQLDPEYFKTRQATSNRLKELLSGNLSPGEIEAITRGQNRLNVAAGLDVPNNTATVASALQFGQAARDRQLQGVAAATGAMPAMQTSDLSSLFGMGTGRGRNVNQNLQTSDTTLDGLGIDLATGFANAMAAGKMKGMDIDAGRRTVYDAVNQSWNSAIGSVLGCWVMIEAYDNQLPWHVDIWRREFFPKHQQILNGYRRFAKVVVPLMKKFFWFKQLVRKTFAFPVSDYIARKDNPKTFKFWMKLFHILGA